MANQNQANQSNGHVAPVLSTQNGFAHTASSGLPSYFGIDPNARTPYAQQWNAGIQHELTRRVLLDVSYISSNGTHLGRFRQFNTPAHVEIRQDLAPRPGDLQSLRTCRILARSFNDSISPIQITNRCRSQ